VSLKHRVVLASNNSGKLREIAGILAQCAIELIPQSDFGVPEVAETGSTFVENAIIKAKHASEIAGLPAIADDSGIEVDVLQGAPGIYSARYAGETASDEENLRLLLDNISKSHTQQPVARFHCAVVYLRNADDSSPVIAEGTWEGYMVSEPKGENGFGYDPIFYVPEYKCTSAELAPDIKNSISHRALALTKLALKLELDTVLSG